MSQDKTNAQEHQQQLVGDEDWTLGDNGGGHEDVFSPPSPLCADVQTNNSDSDDWLTSLPGRLGEPATTLEAIVQGGSFPLGSNAPSFYFFESQNPGLGAKYLSAKPFCATPADVSDKEAEFHLRMTKFLTRLTKTDQQELAYFLFNVFNYRDPDLSIFKATRPPYSTEDFNDFYVAGKNSITKHLPTPVVLKTADEAHSYVSLTDVIQNMLAASTAVDQFQFESDMVPQGLHSQFFDDAQPATISTSRAAYSLYLDLKEEGSGFVLYLWIKRWCDDFDPNNTKQSRNQVWLMTNTMCPPPGESKGRNTFFMAIGQKGDDHQEIDKIFEEELRVLSTAGKCFYHGGRREIIRVKAGTVCVCVDRPERASIYQVGDHQGSFSTMWGYAIEVDGRCEENCLPSCPFCRRKRLSRSLLSNASNFAENPVSAENSADLDCPNDAGDGRCVSWNVMSSDFTCAAPVDYPTTYDTREGAPLPPIGRDEFLTGNNLPRLPCIHLSIDWLTQAVVFAHHQRKTRPPNKRVNQRYWTKANFVAYLRTCGFGSKLYNAIMNDAENGRDPILPYSWSNKDAIKSAHFAAMHMLFLGHAKSNYDMSNKVLSHYTLSSTAGRQANKYLRDILLLRCNRYFDAQPLSTSKWGTGVWVSENYLFWVRALNFFSTLPALLNNKHTGKPKFDRDLRMVQRFNSSSLVAISRIMSNRKSVGDMDEKVKMYLDTMVEMDRWLHETGLSSDEGDTNVDENTAVDTGAAGDSNELSSHAATEENATEELGNSGAAVASNGDGPATKKKRKRKKKTKDTYNFCKSNSLGILSVAEAHRHHGPAVLHWEGGWAGERKIQQCKPQLSIKRATADWQKLVLQNLWRADTLSSLIESTTKQGDESSTDRRHDMEGQIRIYANVSTLLNDNVEKCKPLSAMLAIDGSVWIAYRPTMEDYRNDLSKTTERDWSRSAVQLLRVNFDDANGEMVSHLCWMAPIQVSMSAGNLLTLGNSQELAELVAEYILLLPKMNSDEEYTNSYYGIGSKWTVRGRNGGFKPPEIVPELFQDWMEDVLAIN